MHLKSLQILGFKSFAKKTVFEFARGITAIVGPNGSGKSNVADSIRWVMGEQSIKTLRGKKSEDVIFAGSDKKARLGMAEVSLELDNSDKKVPINYNELLISRKIYRSGESDYLINGAKSRLVDVNSLLTKANFGHRTYSVIGQGMIDNFLMATPQERKEFFEEASGVKQYQIKKNEALNKFNGTWQNLGILNVKLSEMEPQLKLLTRQAKKLEKRKKIEQELYHARLEYYSKYWREIDNKFLAHKKKLDEYVSEQNKAHVITESLKNQVKHIVQDSVVNEKIEKLREKQQIAMEDKMKLKENLLHLKMKLANEMRQVVMNVKNISYNELENINREIEYIDMRHKKLIGLLTRENNAKIIVEEITDINKKVDEILQFIKPYIKKEIINIQQESFKNIETRESIASGEEEIQKRDKEIVKIQIEIKKLTEEDQRNRSGLWQAQQAYQDEQNRLNNINAKMNDVRVELARVETKRYDLRQEINNELGSLGALAQYQDDGTDITNEQKTIFENRINKFKTELAVIGGIDPEIEAEYVAVKERYDFLMNQTTDLKNALDSLKKLVNDLDNTIKKQMKESFNEINKYFQKYFNELFIGGRAELVLMQEKEFEQEEKIEDEESAFDEKKISINFFQEKSKKNGYAGIEVKATPPGKKLKSIAALSGGERALTSIALICAIISANPSPFVLLDEVDAALDEINSIRFAEILNELAHKTQFIVITHNRATMEKAKLLYGVTIGNDGISKLVSLKFEIAKQYINR
ncbi:hypothetical protein COT27_00550 [Candidatus Kuenenbacteria bacterium CG08_land_8_20_14_0_20_37_23]|uniref:RecF/RecN/SMC N-terminal domain-containing protein n=2 Tax=Candidatus Kueneniibacteriota TaxID=1752740 RepID=A0A2M6XTG8_9BACT|nr:MAG: hypothetical protein AUJ29_03410 [Candidatus Kuenenbacteria bacterium CG1_02_38_13]PIU10924.1 MAG: hypothetical protein COT27_00550 [Candidatus Kuenenbacteria bacterium CG08_land_8_20_14_0_20_37_23]